MKSRKNVFTVGIILIFFGAILTSSVNTTCSIPNEKITAYLDTIIVDNEGDGDFTTIQDAIDSANPGEIILVYSGNYNENIVVDKAINLIGEDEELGDGIDVGKPVIDGTELGNSVLINADNVKLEGFKVQNSGNDLDNIDAGISIQSDNNMLISNEITDNEFGIYVKESSGNNISENFIFSNEATGILLNYSNDNYLYRNEIYDNKLNGIFLDSSNDNNIILFNNMSNNLDTGIHIMDETNENNLIYNNNFFGNEFNARDFSSIGLNKWYNDNIGNFWSNQWYRKDTDNDGISNIPYYILRKGIDRYPLMEPSFNTPEPIPPSIDEIEIPKEGYIHIGNSANIPSFGGKILIIAFPWMDPLELKVRVNSAYTIDAVLAYVDFDETKPWDNIRLESKLGSNLFTGKLTMNIMGSRILTFIAYDIWGVASDPVEMEITCLYIPKK